jgi:hypothetical protein
MFCYHRSLIKSTFFFQLVSRSCNVLNQRRLQIWFTSCTVRVISVGIETWSFLFWKFLKTTGNEDIFFKRSQKRFDIERGGGGGLVVVTDGVPYILGRRSRLQVSIRTVDADVGTACVTHRQTLTATTWPSDLKQIASHHSSSKFCQIHYYCCTCWLAGLNGSLPSEMKLHWF